MKLTRRQKRERAARRAFKEHERQRQKHELWMKQNEPKHVRVWDRIKRYGKDSVLAKVMF